MKEITIERETRLQSSKIHEIEAVLDYKLETTSPEGVADYIGLTLQNIDDKLNRVKEAEAQLKQLKSELSEQVELIKVGSAKWLSDSGLDKLSGMYVSSVSVSKTKPKEELKVTNEESLINQGYFKTVVDKTAVKNAIKDGVVVKGAELEVTHCEDSLRVNRRKKVDAA